MKLKIKNVELFNFSNLSINQFINIFIALIVTPILFQRLGDVNFGLVNYVFSIFILLSILISYGYHLNGPKLISQSEKKQNDIFLICEIISLRLFLAFIISFLIISLVLFTNFFYKHEFIVLLSIPILISEAIHPVFYLQGKDDLFKLTVLNGISKIFYMFLIISYIDNPNDAHYVNLFYGTTLVLVYSFFWTKFFFQYNKIKFKWLNFKNIFTNLSQNFEYFLSSLAGHISINSSLIILKVFVDEKELGQFALANKIALLLRMIPIFLIQSVLQSASFIFKNDNKSFKKYLNIFYIRGLILTFFVGVFFIFFSNLIIKFFAGNEIEYINQILIILSFVPFFATLNFKNIIIILIKDKKKILNKATWISLIIMIIFSVFMSYKFNGIGLAIALVISEIFNFLIHYYLLKLDEK